MNAENSNFASPLKKDHRSPHFLKEEKLKNEFEKALKAKDDAHVWNHFFLTRLQFQLFGELMRQRPNDLK
jgi:hypothetical protein